MTRAQRQRLKEIDEQLLRCALPMQTLLQERSRLDQTSTQQFIDALHATFQRMIDTPATKGATK